MSLSVARRLDEIAEGLALLVEHVATLNDDLSALIADRRARSVAALGIQAEEEAAKVLILLDLIRMGWKYQRKCNEQLDRFYDHLARGIYADVVHYRPASFAELRRLVDLDRRSRYLDGPNDVDWIFRNEILTRRENSLYVDFVSMEQKDTWVTPAERDSYGSAWRTEASELAMRLHRLGATSRPGLEIVASAWRGVSITDTTRWQEVATINEKIASELAAADLTSSDMSAAEVAWVCDRWTFPMGGLELDEIEVTDADLKAQRDRWLAEQL